MNNSLISRFVSESAFHLNFDIDQTAKCGSSRCDTAYLPKLVLYLRGDVKVNASGAASGEGTVLFIGAEACQTLMPDVSACRITSATAGRFTIEGEQQGDQLKITLHAIDLPRLGVTMTTQHPVQGSLDVAMDTTYAQEIKQVLADAKIFDTLVTVSPALTASGNAHLYEGRYIFGANNQSASRTTHGLGGLFFIPIDTPLPAPYVP